MKPSPQRKYRSLLATAVVLAGTFTVPTAQAAPSTPSTVDSAWAAMLAQRPLVEAAEKLKAAVDKGTYPGFAGIRLEAGQVALYWKGALPAPLSAAVRDATGKAPVRLAPAAYSERELRDAAAKIRAHLDVGQDKPVQDVKIPADGSGLVLSMATPAAEFGSDRLAGVPVKTVREAPFAKISRPDAAPPWPGGARTWNRTLSSICTSGFGVRDSAGARFILTAAHCGNAGDRIDDGAGQNIGNVGARNGDHDIELVPTSSVASTIYVGGGTSDTVTPVAGWGDVFIGQLLCQGGVTSAEKTGGPVCDLEVTAFLTSQDLVEATQTAGLDSARGGDSGGPVYSAGSGGVIANGTSTWAAGPRFGFQDFATANADFGVSTP